ncbi:MAG: NAD+ synthase [Burkholderiales bacterium]|jgi:NAD+ synthase (glutamine-hydrolysing)|nr:NAD+ synthase [Burkholderiales bacterium]MDP4909137.1 NAD+ synthase [Burkholderiaceae bacterium]
MSAVRVGIAQLNPLVGDLTGNARLVLEAAQEAYRQGARVLLTPELMLTGYPPEDLLLRPDFVERCEAILRTLCQDLSDLRGMHVVVGHVCQTPEGLRNAASVLVDGAMLGTYFKQELPNYSVFDEKRYFTSGAKALGFSVDGVRFGINICEDIWGATAPEAAATLDIQALLVLNASPYSVDKQAQRVRIALRCVERTHCALVYANLVGAQDELVFDGASFALTREGQLVLRAADFETCLSYIEVSSEGLVSLSDKGNSTQGMRLAAEVLSKEAQIWEALKVCLTDYVKKNGFRSVILGLSGGIDSAVVMAVAVDALGAEHVHAVMMPSRYTADISQIDARDMVKRLGVEYREIAIADLASSFDQVLAPIFTGRAPDVTEENIQARLRGMLLMALSNKFGHLVLTTGNKSELSTGYCTLYGDMAGGFAVLKDVAKTMVYRLARWRNTFGEVIPVRIITRPPSAELREDQTDQDNLPEYEVIDAIIEHYVERNASPAQIVAAGYSVAAVDQVVRLIRISEYKRKQGPFGPRITERAFGRDWRYPLSNGFRD